MIPKSFSAVVRVSLDIHVTGSWSEDTPMSQVRKQAIESAEQTLGNLIGEETNPGTQTAAARRVKSPTLMRVELSPGDAS
jgi:hypothetical protein